MIAPVPGRHPYVDAVLPLERWAGFERFLPPEVADLRDGQWRPHPLLEADALRAHAGRIDVLHLHFGVEHRSPRQIQELVDACRDADVRLVVTVHDLQNPHLEDQAEHLERMRLLVAAAHTVITLTDGAAEEIVERFGRRPVVLPHPFVVDPDTARRVRAEAAPRRSGGTVGVFLKDLRASTVRDPQYFRDLAEELPGARLRVHLDERRADTPLAEQLAAVPRLELVVHPRRDDAALHAEVAACDVVVLPYLRGTHSGWLEMCRDLDVTVVAPACGHYTGQADRPQAVLGCATGDGRAAARAARAALLQGPLPCAVDRRAQAEQVADAHRRLLTAAALDGAAAAAPAQGPAAGFGRGAAG